MQGSNIYGVYCEAVSWTHCAHILGALEVEISGVGGGVHARSGKDQLAKYDVCLVQRSACSNARVTAVGFEPTPLRTGA